ncbi:MAG TPA: hypothetical protein VFY19_08020, partial [Geminicoccaceae bacterium]|nr:hypothetical protein [Geminicoccaceae bacterium]
MIAVGEDVAQPDPTAPVDLWMSRADGGAPRDIEIARELEDAVHEAQRLAAHLLPCGRDVQVVVRRVQAHDAQPLGLDEVAHRAARRV